MYTMYSRSASSRLRWLLVSLVPIVALGAAVAAGIALQARPAAHASGGNLPGALPSHFSFGIMDSPGGTGYLNGMRTSNGTSWDYRYQYLAGGVNTNQGWETWNTPAGAFATYYMQDSGSSGYIPTFVYYEMVQSNGSCGSCSEPQKVLSNLGNASTMAAYYANWALLMQKIGGYGKPVLVVVEPDLWGFVEQAVANSGNSAANQVASVTSSGFAGAAGLPDTVQGFAWALLKIRDQYAHNAVLALHASPWGTGRDIGSDTDPSLDAAAVGQQQAHFLNTAGLVGNPSGISSFDVVSNDVADHDSGQSGTWWDRNNVTFPNFKRYLTYIDAVSTGTDRRVVMWQVPVGNQYFDTENNTQGHTQDNRAEYILGHIADFANAGVIAVLFGPGNGGTSVQDARGDGVTNPAPISTYECNGCNSHTSSYADDDGGYLRVFLGQYYRSGGYALSGTVSSTASPSPSNTPTAGIPSTPTPGSSGTPASTCVPTVGFGTATISPASISAGTVATLSIGFTASCVATGLVDFEVYSATGSKVWQQWQDNQQLTGQAQTLQMTWTIPTDLASGTYVFKVGVFSAGWGTLYGWDDSAATIAISPAASATTSAALNNVPCTVVLNGNRRNGTCSGTVIYPAR